MTVKELKKTLEGLDENLEVIIWDNNVVTSFATLDAVYNTKINGKTYAMAFNCVFTGHTFEGKIEY
jgi:hypothetical protein